ncbi:tRNA 2-thiouridine(34) synthase MnmA [Miniphocaeibacter halophilus]|uniref:tRNA 2-thiouridine(34) synthase MnmA n=1 Tax=Miniphocaeibacter halophilus TaxID=2931922 RepID=A0AC61MU48_9FIRM|nr:tRNA 2-thiouridine(34) synthase MnmA [Miniphocaeibacter halophilus]QQK07876.1 tRNA 2-thiouridine(34) synthase MnmA [Miniphocaeibacter halophilus]
MTRRVILGMSGGVDSSVSALLLQKQGYEVAGATMNMIPEGNLFKEKYCSLANATEEAKLVAKDLGIEHYIIDLKQEFDKNIIESFVREYSLGYTPNPCIRCNKYIKFGEFLKETKKLGGDYISTGHYAKVEYDKDRERYLLKKAKDSKKDQTYFLYNLKQEILKEVLFPLGDLTKDEVRDIGEKSGIFTYSKKDSEEICFINKDDHGNFIKTRNPELIGVGNFIDEEGNVLGEHKGIVYYTIGQRRGLGIALGKRVFVSKINPKTKEITLSDDESLYKSRIELKDYNLISLDDILEPLEVTAKIRHGVNEYKALVTKKDDKLFLEFEKPVRAPSRGQSAVMYNGDIVVGGGIIENVW